LHGERGGPRDVAAPGVSWPHRGLNRSWNLERFRSLRYTEIKKVLGTRRKCHAFCYAITCYAITLLRGN